ncbi:MAG: OmpH family outer membrane protein, partial [Candidatus Omnitrophota bacterium]
MRRIKGIFMGVLFLLLASTTVFAQTLDGKKIGFLDLTKVFDGYEKTKSYDTVLENKHSGYEKERNAKIEKLREEQGKLALLKEEEKGKLQEELDRMRSDILEFDRQKKTDLTKERDEKIREVLLEIEGVVTDFAKKENYAMVLNDRV